MCVCSYSMCVCETDNLKTNIMNDNLSSLQGLLEKGKSNTTRMLSHLQRFENHLNNIERKMRPIQNTTEKYSKAKKNINLTLIEVEKTYEYFRIAFEAKDVIAAGLNTSNRGNFFEALSKLTLAQKFFKEHKEIKSSETVLTNINSLVKQAVAMCTQEVELILNTCGRFVQVNDGMYTMTNPLDEQSTNSIKTVCGHLEKNMQLLYLESFKKLLSSQVKNCIIECSSKSMQNWDIISNDLPYQSGIHPFSEVYEYTYELLKGIYQFLFSVLQITQESHKVFLAIADVAFSELEKSLIPYLKDKDATKQSLIHHTNKLLSRLDILAIFMNKFDEYKEICRPDFRNESLSLIHIITLRNSVVESCIQSINSLIVITRDSGKFIDHKVSCDLNSFTGNILHCCKQLSNFTAAYKQLFDISIEIGGSNFPTEYSTILDLVLALLSNLLTAILKMGDNFDNGLVKLTVNRLISSTVHSSFEFGDKEAENILLHAQKHLFLLNNLYSFSIYLNDKKQELQLSIDSSGTASATSLPRSSNTRTRSDNIAFQHFKRITELSDAVESRLFLSQSEFCQIIALALGMTAEDISHFRSLLEKDRSGKYRVLKSKFAIFNSGMEAFLSHQGNWRISTELLRDRMSRMLLETILPVYSSFFETYSTIHFSKKHMDEYIKFSPQQVEKILKVYFGNVSSL